MLSLTFLIDENILKVEIFNTIDVTTTDIKLDVILVRIAIIVLKLHICFLLSPIFQIQR